MTLEDDVAFRRFAEAYGKAWAGRNEIAAVAPEATPTTPSGTPRIRRPVPKVRSPATVKPVA